MRKLWPTKVIATLALGSRPKQGVTKLRAKRETRESLHMLLGVQRAWGNEPSNSQVNSHVTVGVPKGLSNFQSAIAGVKTPRLEVFFISLESYWSVNVYNGLALLIWTSVAQVMAKRKTGNQMTIWLPATKSRELTRFPCVQATCNIPLESFRQGL
jgi:hypothetical protein